MISFIQINLDEDPPHNRSRLVIMLWNNLLCRVWVVYERCDAAPSRHFPALTLTQCATVHMCAVWPVCRPVDATLPGWLHIARTSITHITTCITDAKWWSTNAYFIILVIILIFMCNNISIILFILNYGFPPYLSKFHWGFNVKNNW